MTPYNTIENIFQLNTSLNQFWLLVLEDFNIYFFPVLGKIPTTASLTYVCTFSNSNFAARFISIVTVYRDHKKFGPCEFLHDIG